MADEGHLIGNHTWNHVQLNAISDKDACDEILATNQTIKEITDKEQAPNVSAAQCWLYNRLPKKWKNMNSRANILDDMDEDTSIQVIVTRATKDNVIPTQVDDSVDTEWQDEINSSIEIRKSTEEERVEAEKAKAKAKSEIDSKVLTKVESEPDDDLDYWPDDWEEDWED